MVMSPPSEAMLLNALNSIDYRLAKIERWMDGHDHEHRERADKRTVEMVEYESRLTQLESGTTVKTVIGALSIMAVAILEALRQVGIIR